MVLAFNAAYGVAGEGSMAGPKRTVREAECYNRILQYGLDASPAWRDTMSPRWCFHWRARSKKQLKRHGHTAMTELEEIAARRRQPEIQELTDMHLGKILALLSYGPMGSTSYRYVDSDFLFII